MKIKVFVSMSFKNKTEEDIKRYLHFTEIWCKNIFEYVNDDDEIEAVCNYYNKQNAPDYVYNMSTNKKLADLGRALSLMSTCDDFVLFANEDGSIPFGCNLELMAWTNSSYDHFIQREPTILNSSLVKW